MNHHVWCHRMKHDQMPDGACKMCQGLYLKYPPQGDLDYEPMQEESPEIGSKTA